VFSKVWVFFCCPPLQFPPLRFGPHHHESDVTIPPPFLVVSPSLTLAPGKTPSSIGDFSFIFSMAMQVYFWTLSPSFFLVPRGSFSPGRLLPPCLFLCRLIHPLPLLGGVNPGVYVSPEFPFLVPFPRETTFFFFFLIPPPLMFLFIPCPGPRFWCRLSKASFRFFVAFHQIVPAAFSRRCCAWFIERPFAVTR